MKHTQHTLVPADSSDTSQIVEVVNVRPPLHIHVARKTYKLAILDGWLFMIMGLLMAGFAFANYFNMQSFTTVSELFSERPDLYIALAAFLIGLGLNRFAKIMEWWEND
jgi:hypothetical protein